MKIVNYKKEPCDVLITRPSILGNIFTHLPIGKTQAMFQVKNRDEAVDFYRDWLNGEEHIYEKFPSLKEQKWEMQRKLVLNLLPSLEGRIFGCCCSPKRCHGEVLIELVEKLNGLSK